MIECGTQATGGNYSFFTEVPGMARTGFPWAEIAADGSSVIGKHDGTGGEVSIGTVTSQLLYEIGGPQYLGPDVTTRFDTIQLEQIGPDRVRMYGIRGEPPPPTLKVCINRARRLPQRHRACVSRASTSRRRPSSSKRRSGWHARTLPRISRSVTTRLTRTDKADPESNEQAVAILQLSVKDPDEEQGRARVLERGDRARARDDPGLLRRGRRTR